MRVLVVDDDPLVLKALDRTFRMRLSGWETVLADSGERAVGLLEQAPFDLVLTDMQMPGLDGSMVLRRAMDLQPDAVRVVLSGHAPLRRIMEAEGHYHRFLTKPIDPEELMAILEAFCLDGSKAGTARARSFVTGLERIPSLPRHLDRLRVLLDQPKPDLAEVVAEIVQDIGMASRVLKLVNSAFLSFGRSITDLNQAAEYLGMDTIQELLAHQHALSSFEDETPEGLDLTALWTHSRHAGLVARGLVLRATGDRAAAAEAYSVGLLHDVGMVVLATTPSSGYRSILERQLIEGGEITALERAKLGTDHVQVGSELVSLWGLPASFSTVIREHHGSHLGDFSSLKSLALQLAHSNLGRAQAPGRLSEGSFIESPGVPQAGSVEELWDLLLPAWESCRREARAQPPLACGALPTGRDQMDRGGRFEPPAPGERPYKRRRL